MKYLNRISFIPLDKLGNLTLVVVGFGGLLVISGVTITGYTHVTGTGGLNLVTK